MKYLLLLLVVAVAVWMFTARSRKADRPADPRPPRKKKGEPAGPTPMLACAHCGVHLPQSDALFDVSGKPFCTEAHRLAGPR